MFLNLFFLRNVVLKILFWKIRFRMSFKKKCGWKFYFRNSITKILFWKSCCKNFGKFVMEDSRTDNSKIPFIKFGPSPKSTTSCRFPLSLWVSEPGTWNLNETLVLLTKIQIQIEIRKTLTLFVFPSLEPTLAIVIVFHLLPSKFWYRYMILILVLLLLWNEWLVWLLRCLKVFVSSWMEVRFYLRISWFTGFDSPINGCYCYLIQHKLHKLLVRMWPVIACISIKFFILWNSIQPVNFW